MLFGINALLFVLVPIVWCAIGVYFARKGERILNEEYDTAEEEGDRRLSILFGCCGGPCVLTGWVLFRLIYKNPVWKAAKR